MGQNSMASGAFGWIEIVFFYGIAIGFAVWQWLKMDRMLKKGRAEKAVRDAAETRDDCEDDKPPTS